VDRGIVGAPKYRTREHIDFGDLVDESGDTHLHRRRDGDNLDWEAKQQRDYERGMELEAAVPSSVNVEV
jgi:hypothetical protein